ncbi:hypothetical protein H4R18_002844 [Coemansia javaensis]|uniref:Uncharacterized protein n=1 Tax=Coemansia javaensis TaxID=2761396 RepID=A0A9W8HAK3_9FUNG|nr:hypothetical protein H4R18_002844 [Coemansia javaensis]
MSFEYTPREKLRVALASLLGVHLDPIGHGDLAVVCVWAAIYAVQLAAVLYALRHRKYPPIESCQPVLMALFYAAGVLWYVGDITSNELVHLDRRPLTNCMFVIVWMRSALGQNMLFALLVYRCILLWFAYRNKAALTRTALLSFAVLVLAAVLVPAIVSSFLPETKTVQYISGMDVCQFNATYKAAVVTLTWLSLGSLMAVSVLLNATLRCVHGEHRRMAAACVPLAVSAAFHTVIFFRKPMYPASFSWRVAVVSIDQASVLCAWWIIMGHA